MPSYNIQSIGLGARRSCCYLANKALKGALFFSEPIQKVQEPEINYYGFTLITLLHAPAVNAIKLTEVVSSITLPVIWNYLDGASAIAVGINQLLNKDDYRQKQMKAKGLLNIISGIQLYLLSYNPPLVAALGITGAPAALAGASFALAMLIDLITISMDFCTAYKERHINGWLEEKYKEHSFISQRITAFQAQGDIKDDSKIADLLAKQEQLEIDIRLRYKVQAEKIEKTTDAEKITDNNKKLLLEIIKDIVTIEGNPPKEKIMELNDYERSQDKKFQKDLDNAFREKRDTLVIRAASFVGMSLLAVGTFALFTACPPAVATVGLAITVVVSVLYLSRHSHKIANALEKPMGRMIQAMQSFFKPCMEAQGSSLESAADPSTEVVV